MALVFTVESADNELPSDVSADQVAELEATVADESAVVQGEAEEGGVSVAEVEAAVQEGEELEAVADVAAASLEDGGEGLTEDAAEIAAVAIERARARLGFPDVTRITPAREQFGSSSSRRHATVMVVEGIADTIKTIWESIKKMAIRLWEKVKLFVAGLFSSTEQLNKLIVSLQKRARDLPSNGKLKEKKIKTGLAAKIAVAGKANLTSFEDMVASTEKLFSVGKKLSSAASEYSAAAGAMAGQLGDTDFLKKLGDRNSQFNQEIKAAVGSLTIDSAVDLGTAALEQKKRKGVSMVHYGPFVGGAVLTLEGVKRELKNGGKVAEYSLQGERYSLSFAQDNKGKKATEVEALTRADIEKVLAAARKLSTGLADYKTVSASLEKVTANVQKTADAVIKAAGSAAAASGANAETRLGLAELRSDVVDTIAFLNVIGQRSPALIFGLAKAGADYASLSIRNIVEG